MEVTQWRERGGGSVVAWLSLREGKSRSRLIKEFRYIKRECKSGDRKLGRQRRREGGGGGGRGSKC